MLRKSFFIGLLLMMFAVMPCLAVKMGDIAIFTESVGWTTVATANEAAQIILDNLKLTKNIEILGDGAIGDFAEANTDDGDMDIIILFGYFPVSLYAPANGEADDSVGEIFLEGGNMFINTADYIFYVTQGGGVNGDTGLKNMTDSNFDMWGNDNTTEATEDGEKYTPSLVGVNYVANRPFKISQVNANPDWELEVIFGSNGDEAEPAVIRNLDYDGRVAVVFQTPNDATVPRGEVMVEMLDNWLSTIVGRRPVEPAGKLSATWGEIKHSF